MGLVVLVDVNLSTFDIPFILYSLYICRIMKINPYLNFDGTAEAAFTFYKGVFGGEFLSFQRFSDVPDADGMPPVAPDEANRVMHVALQIGDNVLMASDTSNAAGHPKPSGNNVYISIDADSKSHADSLFSQLSDGGDIEMPLADTFWGAYFGMCTDRFGIRWMISAHQ
jgi:PhnB protein